MKSLIFLFLSVIFYHAEAQCELKYEVETVSANPQEPAGKIILRITTPTRQNFSMAVYDIMDQSVPVVQERKVAASHAQNPIVFSALKPTTYAIQVQWGKCKKTIGGLEGIKIDQK